VDQITTELAFYVFKHYTRLLTTTERRAKRHLLMTYKATMGRSDLRAQAEVRAQGGARAQWLSDDPEVLALVADGLEAFQARVAERILAEHANEVVLNYCPRCSGLTRTPGARWCPHCGYDWH